MGRIARVVAPGVAHHVTPRGNYRRRSSMRTRIENVIWRGWPITLSATGLGCGPIA